MELSQLHYFRTVATTEHFTRAAEQLHITQPSLSKSISNLEQELGVVLFDRCNNRVRLNVYGKAFLDRVEQILALTDESVAMLRDMNSGDRGHVRIGAAFPITPPSLIYDYQCRFFRERPGVFLSMHTLPRAQIESMLLGGDLDFGICPCVADQAGIISRALYTDRIGIIVGPGHPLHGAKSVPLELLAGERFLRNTSSPDDSDSTLQLCALAGFRPEIIYEGEAADLIGESVALGKGVSFVTEDRFRYFSTRPERPDWQDSLHYVALQNDFCTRTIYLLYRAAGYQTQTARQFLEGLEQQL